MSYGAEGTEQQAEPRSPVRAIPKLRMRVRFPSSAPTPKAQPSKGSCELDRYVGL